MKVLTKEQLSKNQFITDEGYLICIDAILARTGIQTYRKSELFNDSSDEEIEVNRLTEQVFSNETIASFENKPITIEHPEGFVDSTNYNELAVGFVRDVKKKVIDSQEFLVGNLIITNKEAIEVIKDGKNSLSCGYDCDIIEKDGKYFQENIRGNHVALCDIPRAGNTVIQDSIIYEGYKISQSKLGYIIEKNNKLIGTSVSLGDSRSLVDNNVRLINSLDMIIRKLKKMKTKDHLKFIIKMVNQVKERI